MDFGTSNSLWGTPQKTKRVRFDDHKEPVRTKILSCTNCNLADAARGPVPYTGPFPTRLCIVGEAVGHADDARGQPFSGPSGEALFTELRNNGVNPTRLFYCNLISCLPLVDGKKKPTKDHIQACSSNAWAQIELSGAEWVMLLGSMTLEQLAPWQFWSSTPPRISDFHSIPWIYKDRKWVAVVHPAAGLRQEKYEAMFRSDVRRVVEMIRNGIELGEDCYVCGKSVERYDEFGIAWCESHRPRASLGRERPH